MMKYCPQCQNSYTSDRQFCQFDGTKLLRKDPYNLVGRTIVKKYRIDELIGAGGLGAVYKAHQLGIDRTVALKILQPNITNKQTISLFEREAKTAGSISHNNIATIYDSGCTSDGVFYIVMQWVEGVTLQDEIVASAPFSLERTTIILKQIGWALDAAHDARILHRDLKPSNIMLTRQIDGSDKITLLDFGISKVLSATEDSPVSALMGTPHYASPEQLQVGKFIDRRTDIYSLGVVIFQMLTKTLPFEASSIQELVQMHLTAPPPSLRQRRPDVPEAVERLVVERMLAKEPNKRPIRAGEVYKEFSHIVNPALRDREKKITDKTSSTTTPILKRVHASSGGNAQTKKACILGAYAVGKTSLMTRFVKSIFSERYHTTIGVNVNKKEVIVDGQEVKLMLWDLAGEDDYLQVRTTYLRGTAGYLLVVDRTRPDTLDKAVELKERVDAELGSIPFILVFNKSDLTEKLRVTAEQVEKFRQDGWDVLETSAKTGQGVEAAFLRLTRRMLQE